MTMMYSLATLPLVYAYSFNLKSEIIGFISFFIINAIACFLEMILDFISVFSQAQSANSSGRTALSSVLVSLTWVLEVIFPSVNYKSALFDIRLKSNPDCIDALNSLLYTSYSSTDPWMSMSLPGLGIPFVIFCGQMILWWFVLILIENGTNIRLACRRRCKCDRDLQEVDDRNSWGSREHTPQKQQNDGDDQVTLSRISISWPDDVRS